MGRFLSSWLARLRDLLKGLLRPAPTAPPRALPPPRSGRLPDGDAEGALLWIHAGQAAPEGSVRALIEAIDENAAGLGMIVTWQGKSPADDGGDGLAALRRDPPEDTPAAARAFLDEWQPDAVLFLGADLPRATIAEAGRRLLPLHLICDPLADRMPRSLLRRFHRIYATDSEQADRLRRMGAAQNRIEVTGAPSEIRQPPTCNETERENFARLLAGRPTWLAAQTSTAEDLIIVEAHASAARLAHRLLLILVPDDESRGPDLARSLRREGWRVALRSNDEEPEEETQVFVADTTGEMGLWYRVSPISFLGGSLDPGGQGGIDPSAPAALGSAILHGPHSGAHEALYTALQKAGASRKVRDATGLARALNTLIAPDKAAALAHSAWEVSSAGAETTGRIVAGILASLDDRRGA